MFLVLNSFVYTKIFLVKKNCTINFQLSSHVHINYIFILISLIWNLHLICVDYSTSICFNDVSTYVNGTKHLHVHLMCIVVKRIYTGLCVSWYKKILNGSLFAFVYFTIPDIVHSDLQRYISLYFDISIHVGFFIYSCTGTTAFIPLYQYMNVFIYILSRIEQKHCTPISTKCAIAFIYIYMYLYIYIHSIHDWQETVIAAIFEIINFRAFTRYMTHTTRR